MQLIRTNFQLHRFKLRIVGQSRQRIEMTWTAALWYYFEIRLQDMPVETEINHDKLTISSVCRETLSRQRDCTGDSIPPSNVTLQLLA